MNRELIELREVIQKLVPLLTGKGLVVTQRGSQAYVSTDPKTKKPLSVNIPMVPDNASPEFVRAIQGYIDHEVAHVLITDWHYYGGGVSDPKVLRTAAYQAFQNTHNIVEDTMIEREIVKIFPGSRKNIADLRRLFIKDISLPAIKAATGNDKEQFRYIIVPLMRALAGHEEFIEMMDAHNLWDNPYAKEIVAKLSPESRKALLKCSSTKQTLEIAKDLHAILYPSPPPAPPMPESEDKPDKEAGPGKGEAERKHSKEAPEDTDELESSDAPSGEGDDTADPEDDADREPSDGKDEGEGDTSDETDEGDTSDETDEGDTEDEGGSKESDGETDESDEPLTLTDDDIVKVEGEMDGAPGASEGSGGSAKSDDGVGTGMFADDGFGEDAFEGKDMGAAIGEVITREALLELKSEPYTVFTRELDRIEPLDPGDVHPNWVPQMEDRVRQMIGRMQKDIERMMASHSHVIRTPGHRNGKLHSASLYRVPGGDARVFTQKQESVSKDTVVTLLIDNSGSMRGTKQTVAMLSAYALSLTLERVNIPHEVLGFTTLGFNEYDIPDSIRRALEGDMRASGLRYNRTLPLYMPIYKGVDERIGSTVKQRFARAIYAADYLAGNIDGECLEYAAMRMMKRRERRKVMLVLSDGAPIEARDAPAHLRHTVENLTTKWGIDCIGIGIQDNSVKKFYPKSVVLHNVEDLPGQVMQELKKILS